MCGNCHDYCDGSPWTVVILVMVVEVLHSCNWRHICTVFGGLQAGGDDCVSSS